ncbi:MAG: exo-alpha-sialidase [Thermoguttaceae bacterium]
MNKLLFAALIAFLSLAGASSNFLLGADDPRNIRSGSVIPDEGYCDQPYVVISKDGNWLCTLTTGPGKEGNKGQHVVSTISADKGKTWSKLVDIEPSGDVEASWALPLIVPSGRVYAFYTYNGDNVNTLPGSTKAIRSDTHGWLCYKYSDDNGRTWSAKRYRIPIRLTACDRGNQWKGKVQMFWGIDKPKVYDHSVMFAITKLARYFLTNGEGWILRSDNILTENDPDQLHWQTLPDGEHGIRDPEFGSVQEEFNMVPLNEKGHLYCVYRTTKGYPCHVYSNDGGHTWTKPEYMTYTPGGQKIKNPRACPKLWKTADGHYLFWFHNHNGKDFRPRNPVWIVGGVEKDGRMEWSQPEILLYDPSLPVTMSYPDLIEEDGRFWVTETNKSDARIHEVDRSLLEGLWNQSTLEKVASEGLALDWKSSTSAENQPSLSQSIDLRKSTGITVDCWLRLDNLDKGQVLLDSRGADGAGIVMTTIPKGAVRVELSDGKNSAVWASDPGLLQAGQLHHVVVIADGGPKITTGVIDGVLCDGGEFRLEGWGRWKGDLGAVAEVGPIRVGAGVKSLRIYDRYLRTSEAVGNFHSGINHSKTPRRVP